jgi:hypothetical protein
LIKYLINPALRGFLIKNQFLGYQMPFLTEVIVAGVLYDLLKHGFTLTAGSIKRNLKDWVLSDDSAQAISEEIVKLNLTEDMSEKVIQKKITSSEQLMELINTVKPATTTIIQTHNGTGDNIGGNKVIQN